MQTNHIHRTSKRKTTCRQEYDETIGFGYCQADSFTLCCCCDPLQVVTATLDRVQSLDQHFEASYQMRFFHHEKRWKTGMNIGLWTLLTTISGRVFLGFLKVQVMGTYFGRGPHPSNKQGRYGRSSDLGDTPRRSLSVGSGHYSVQLL